jgi:6-methylsalicylic acid synthase
MALHRLFPPGTLDFLVFFSSCGQLVRLTGQASYAAANSFLDTLARVRNAGRHSDTMSLAWTSWRGMGMAESASDTVTMEANARGMDGISVAEAFRAWSYAERVPGPYRAILRVLPPGPHGTRLPVLSELAGTGETESAGAEVAVYTEWLALPEPELRERIVEDLRAQVGAELRLPAADIEPRRPLVELGVDSLLTVGLRIRLHRRYGVDLPATVLWGHPTVAALAAHLAETVREEPGVAVELA